MKSGKTVIASELVRILVEQGKKVFFVVANEPLIMQTYNKFIQIGLKPSIIKSKLEKYYNPLASVQIVMIQSYAARIDKLPDLDVDVIVVDEIDFGYRGQMLKKLTEKHANAQIIGLTGTPCLFNGNLLPGFDFYHEVGPEASTNATASSSSQVIPKRTKIVYSMVSFLGLYSRFTVISRWKPHTRFCGNVRSTKSAG